MKTEDIYQQYMYSYPHKTSYREIEEFYIKDKKHLLQNQRNSLYFHIPFCESKCGYCNLFSVTGQKAEVFDRYLEACQRQTEQYEMQDIIFSDLTIGGGTPLLLSEKQLEKLFSMAKSSFGWTSKPYTIIETSPNQTTWEKLCLLRDENVSRVSIGVQSFCQEELDNLCRHHTVNRAREAIKLLKKAEFECLNIDLIYGIKGQTTESLGATLKETISYEPQEIFIYPLYIKPNTILDLKHEISSEQRYYFYCFIRDFLCENGYSQLSMRRFSRINRSEKKEPFMIDCGFENTISIGCGGRSYINNIHFCTRYGVKQENCRRILNEYIECQDYNKISYGYVLSDEEIKRRYVMKNLLVSRGMYLEDYRKRFNADMFTDYPVLSDFMEKGYILKEKQSDNHTRVYLSQEGLGLSDYIGPQLISDEVRQRMREWKE